MDVFTGQMTPAVLDAFKEENICIVNVPANRTKFYQPLDLTVNGYAKRFLKRKFNEWYSGQVKTQLDKNIAIEDVQVGLQLTRLKRIHAAWLVEFYNHMTTSKGKEIIDVVCSFFLDFRFLSRASFFYLCLFIVFFSLK